MHEAYALQWGEEYLLETAGYLRALYYPSRLRPSGLRAQQLTALIDDAVDLVMASESLPPGAMAPPPPGANLSPSGRVFVRACARAPAACEATLDILNDAGGDAHGHTRCTATPCTFPSAHC